MSVALVLSLVSIVVAIVSLGLSLHAAMIRWRAQRAYSATLKELRQEWENAKARARSANRRAN